MSMHYNEHDPELPPPPAAPKLMKLTIFEGGEWLEEYEDVTGSSMAGPAVFRFETLDGRIVLCDMAGRDFVLTPQEADDE